VRSAAGTFLRRRRGEAGEGGRVARGATQRHEVGQGPGPIGRRWAAGSSPAAACSGGWPPRYSAGWRQDKGGRGSLTGAPVLQCKAARQRAGR
jgi:hypothetical protein